jgi:type 1 fimbria pilin
MPVYVAACAGVTNGTQTVQLPKVSTSTFAKGATTSSWIANTRFTISLGSCSSTATNAEGGNTTGYQAHITWSYTAAAGNATLVASTGTSNVAVSLLRSDNSPVRNDTDDVYTLTNGTNTFTYYATYYAPVQPATPGTVSATANFTVTYQ